MIEKENTILKIGLVEPYFGGSHKAFSLGWQRHSSHEIVIEGLPARFWKWRMRAAAFEMVRRVGGWACPPELWFASSLMDVAHFKALKGDDAPVITFFHECQAAYPVQGGELAERDYQYLLTDLASAAAADGVVFNSASLRDAFLEQTGEFLRRMPDARPLYLLDQVADRSYVLPLGVELSDLAAPPAATNEVPVVLWCHRWEHDKNPEAFFAVLERLAARGVEFRVAVAGGRYEKAPKVFDRARRALGERIIHWGEVTDRGEYGRLLAGCDVVVSTALHETFGIAMVEAAWAGVHPLAPRRLSYPEVFAQELHPQCLYGDEAELERMLEALLDGSAKRLERGRLREIFGRYDWSARVADFDSIAVQVFDDAKL